RYRELPVLLSDHPRLVAVVLGGGDAAAASAVLQQKADQTGTREIRLLDGDGRLLAAAGELAEGMGAAPAFRRAMNGALGSAHYVSAQGRRLFTFAAPVFSAAGPAVGAVLVTIDLSEIEWNWPSDPFAVFFTDANGVVYVTSRSELVLARRGGGAGQGVIRDFPPLRVRDVQSHSLWDIDGGRYLPLQAMHLTQPMPVIAMTGEILIDTAPARRIAFLQGAAAGALALAFGAMFYVAAERRRTLAERLAAEAAANAELEGRVQARTAELSSTNTALRREVFERHEAEGALRRAGWDIPKRPKQGDVKLDGEVVGRISNFEGLVIYKKDALAAAKSALSGHDVGIWNPQDANETTV
ncbi:MAG: cache domain-containing protein, partial [Paracoccaceae bacterium]